MVMLSPNPQEIIRMIEARVKEAVDWRRGAFMTLYQRMDADERLYRREYYPGQEMMDEARQAGVPIFKSNEPTVYANKVMEFASSASININIPVMRETEEQQTINQFKRDVIRACLANADRRMTEFAQPLVKDQLAYFGALRGWLCGRAMLMRNDMGETVVDITPWDPLNLVWDVGPHGIEWICNVSYMTANEIRALGGQVWQSMELPEGDQQTNYLVYDFYDRQFNLIFAEGADIKQATRHGAQRLPAFVVPATGTPVTGGTGQLWGSDNLYDRLAYSGESCFREARDSYIYKVRALTAMDQLVNRAWDPSYTVSSLAGQRRLDRNPFIHGAEIPTRIGEDVKPLPFLAMPDDIQSYLGSAVGEIQRGSLPYNVYGDIGGVQLSGYAIKLLEGGLDSKVMPLIRAMQSAYQFISERLCEQYSTGFYAPLKMAGMYDGLPPQALIQSDPVTISLRPNLPRDHLANMNVAQMARQPGADGRRPLLPDVYARQMFLDVDDEEGMQDMINVQQAEGLTDTTILLTLVDSLIDRGREDLVKELWMDYVKTKMVSQMEMQQLAMQAAMMGVDPAAMAAGGMGGGMNPSPPQGGTGPMTGRGGVPGAEPGSSPQPMLGAMPQSPAFQQSGPVMPPGVRRQVYNPQEMTSQAPVER